MTAAFNEFTLTRGDNVSTLEKMSIKFTADSSSGAFAPFTLSAPICGYVVRVSRMPGSPAPDAGGTLTVTDDDGVDILQGSMAATGSATVGDHLVQSIAVNGTLTIALTGNTTGSAVTTVSLYVDRGTPLPRS